MSEVSPLRAIRSDGTWPLTANLDAGGNQISGLGPPAAPDHAARASDALWSIVDVGGDYEARPGEFVVPKPGLSGYAGLLPRSEDCVPGSRVAFARDPAGGSICKVQVQGADVLVNGNQGANGDNVTDLGIGGLRYAGLYVTDGAGRWVVLS